MDDNAICDEILTDENIDDEILSGNENTDNEILGENNDVGTFSDLHDEIINSEPGKTFELTRDYKFNPETDENYITHGINFRIDNFEMDGKGHTIDADYKAGGILDLGYSSGLTVKNTIFTHVQNVTTKSRAIDAITEVSIINCTFKDNKGQGIAAGSGLIENCTFINNTAADRSGGGFSIESFTVIRNCTFINNTAKSGGAIFLARSGTIENCYFENNKATYYSSFFSGGGAISRYYDTGLVTISNSQFINNTDTGGRAFIVFGDWIISNSTFNKSSVRIDNGWADLNDKTNPIIKDSIFINSKLSNRDGNLTLSNNSFENGYIDNNGTILSQVKLFAPDYTQLPTGTMILVQMTDDMGNSIHNNDSFLENFKISVDGQEVTGVNQVQINGIWFYQLANDLEIGNHTVTIDLIDEEAFYQHYGICPIINGTLKVAEVSSYTDLMNKLSATDDLITLESDYAFLLNSDLGLKGGINIVRDNLIIDGQGHSISGSSFAKFFNITGANVVLKNIVFSDGFSNDGALIYANAGLTIENCTFQNNYAKDGIFYFKDDAIIRNSTFNENIAENGLIFSEGLLNITNSTFSDNDIGESNEIILIAEGDAVMEDVTPEDLKAEHIVIIDVDPVHDTYYPNDVIVTVHVSCEGKAMSTGVIVSSLNDSINQTSIINDGIAIITLSSLSDGNYTLKISYLGDDKHSKPSETIALKVLKTKTMVNAVDSTFNVNYGSTYSVSVTDGFNPISGENVNFIIDDNVFASVLTDSNGIASINLSSDILKALKIGNHDLIVKFDGNDFYYPSEALAKLTIAKGNAKISASNKAYVINYGGNYYVTLKDTEGNVISGEKVTFTLNGKYIGTAITNASGVAKFKLSAKILKAAKAGTKNMIIKFNGKYYNSISKTVKIYIKKEKTKITAKSKSFRRALKTKKYAIILKNSKGKVIKKAKVYLRVKGKTFKATTNTKGKATFRITNLKVRGKFAAKITFKATAYYLKASKKIYLTIK